MTVADFTDSYDRDGYCFPVDVLDGNEIEGILSASTVHSSSKLSNVGHSIPLVTASSYLAELLSSYDSVLKFMTTTYPLL